MRKIELSYICEELQLDEETVLSWVKCRLVQPMDLEGPVFDEEDYSRIRLIADLRETYNTNDESLEIIMHLVDQIHILTSELKKIKEKYNLQK